MKEDKLLEELRAQRDLIRKHLEWIEQKIAEQEGSTKAETNQPLVTAKSEAKEAPPATAVEPEEEITPQPAQEEPPSKETDEEDETEQALKAYQPSRGNDVLRAKVGCLVLFLLCTGLFLFLLFGLPYLLD